MILFTAFGVTLPLSIPLKYATPRVLVQVIELLPVSPETKVQFAEFRLADDPDDEFNASPTYELVNGPPEGCAWMVYRNHLCVTPSLSPRST